MLKERISDLHGLLVVADEEGCQVGIVEDVFIDPKAWCIASLTVRTRAERELRMLDAKALTRLGRDVVFVTTEAALEHVPEDGPLGRNIKALQGARVMTEDGVQLGALVDVDVRTDDWHIVELRLNGSRLLPIAPGQLTIGRDAIVVPAHCGDMVSVSEPNTGLLARLLGEERVAEIEALIRRVRGTEDDDSVRPDDDMGI